MKHSHFTVYTLGSAIGDSGFAACETLVLNLSCKGQRTWHTVYAVIGAVARGECCSVATAFYLGVVVLTVGNEVTSGEWEHIKVNHQWAKTVVHHLTLTVHPRNAQDVAERFTLVQGMKQFYHGSLWLTTHNDDAFVHKALLNEVRWARPHKDNFSLGTHLQEGVDSKHVTLNRQVHRPYAVDVTIVACKKLPEVLLALLVEHKVFIGNLTKLLGLNNANHCEFIDIWSKVHHPCAACRALSRSLSIKYWWH